MSVFTCITRPQLDQFLNPYALGAVLSLEGIKDGIDNTNYFVTTEQGRFVLTLFESLTVNEIPRFLKLLAHLGKNGLLSPSPLSDQEANLLGELNGKPAVLFKQLSGAAIEVPSIVQCQEIGLQLASLHRCTEGYVFPVQNSNDLSWCKTVQNKIGVHLSADERELIDDELTFQTQHSSVNLPRGVIHADLFRDNVLFVEDRLSGLLDFYSACTDTLLLDIAITANDWCCDQGKINHLKFKALLAAYQTLRPLERLEKYHWPIMLRAAALRFWLSRLQHQYYPRPGDITQQKDPLVFKRLLLQHRQASLLSDNTIFNLRSTA